MNVPSMVSQDDSSATETLVYVRCTDEQAVKLSRVLRTQYPAVKPQLIPALNTAQYSHCFRAPEDAAAFKRRWPQIQFQMLLAASMPPTQKPIRLPRPAAQSVHASVAIPTIAPRSTIDPPVRLPSFSTVTAPDAAEGPSLLVDEPQPVPRDPRLDRLDALLAENNHDAVVLEVDPDDPVPTIRATLGVALARQHRLDEALPHLLLAWTATRDLAVALELARIHWQSADFDDAAQAYASLLDGPTNDLELRDYTAIAELAISGEFGELSPARQLTFVENFFAEAAERAPRDSHADSLARRGLELAREVQDRTRMFHAYQHLLDVLIARRAGQGLRELIDAAYHDYWSGLLSEKDRFDLLDEISEYLQDYPLLREPLIEGYQELLHIEVDRAKERGSVLPAYTRDMHRSLRKLTRKNEASDDYRKLLAGAARVDEQEAVAESDAAVRLFGKRIALVGGHERTREHVREWLEGQGARVDEVAPPNNGRIAEREVQDKVQFSDLVLLIVGYMGHDMSKVVSNLKQRNALQGRVLPVDCRGTSGICRAILSWASGT